MYKGRGYAGYSWFQKEKKFSHPLLNWEIDAGYVGETIRLYLVTMEQGQKTDKRPVTHCAPSRFPPSDAHLDWKDIKKVICVEPNDDEPENSPIYYWVALSSTFDPKLCGGLVTKEFLESQKFWKKDHATKAFMNALCKMFSGPALEEYSQKTGLKVAPKWITQLTDEQAAVSLTGTFIFFF